MVILHIKILSFEVPQQELRCLPGIRNDKANIFTVFLLKVLQAFFLQQDAMVDNTNLVGKQRDFGKNMTRNEDGFSLCIVKFADKTADFCDSDRIKTIDGLIQDQQSGLCMTASAIARRYFIPRGYCE